MSKLIYRNDEFPMVEIIAEPGEEVAADQVLACAMFKLVYSMDMIGIGLQRLADEMASNIQ